MPQKLSPMAALRLPKYAAERRPHPHQADIHYRAE